MTLTGHTKLYITDRCRLMTGVEAMSVMGIHYGPERQRRLEDVPETDLRNLAGNAFHAWNCAPSLFCILRLRAEIAFRRIAASQEAASHGGHDAAAQAMDHVFG